MPENDHPFDAAMRKLTQREWDDLKSQRLPLTSEQKARLQVVVEEEFAKPQKSKDPEVPWWSGVRSLLRSPIGYAAAAAALILIGFLVYLTPGPQREMAALPGPNRSFSNLPQRMLLEPKRHRLELVGGTTRFSGQMKQVPNLSMPGVLVFTNNLTGRDSTGAKVWIRSLAWVTNNSGRMTLKSTNDVSGVLLQGTLEIPGQLTNAFEQGYAP